MSCAEAGVVADTAIPARPRAATVEIRRLFIEGLLGDTI
jgi:hypothetical protein